MFRVSRVGSAGLVGLALQLWFGLALVLGLMPSVDMTYSRVCACVCVCVCVC